ncbi:MAG: NAD(P)-dependent alcohol dehydrogenase [Halieaceae bacterium]|nr:NAD(P)-dependent alcohol dehydrogenase [Halieaceae bacterium]
MKFRYKVLNTILAVIGVAVVALAFVLSHNSSCGPAPAVSGEGALMQAIVYRCYGSPEVLGLEKIGKPVPGPDQVLVKVQAASVNPLDWHYMRGSPYFMRLGSGIGAPADQRLGVDFAGTVAAVGEAVTQFKPGDEVFGGASGAFGEYVLVREAGAITLKPASVTFEQAAAVPIAGISALQALRDKGQVVPGMKVLINGASGGVGTFAVQIAKSLGAEVTGVCSERNIDLVRSLGADHVIDYRKQDYTAGDQRYDVIIDNVGNHSPAQNSRALAPDGKLIMVGGPSGNWIGPLKNPLQALLLSPFVDQQLVLFLAQLKQEDLTYLAGLMASGQVMSVIDRRYPLAEVAAAIRYSEEGRARGKILIDVD